MAHLLAIKVKAALDLGEGTDSEEEELVKNSSMCSIRHL